MRISTFPTDPGYENYLKLKDQAITIKKDGVELDAADCLTADEEEGLVLLAVKHSDGTLATFEGEIATRPEYGKIEIIAADRPYDAGEEIRKHQDDVRALMTKMIHELHARASVHDESKFSTEEFIPLQQMGELAQREGKAAFGTPEYERRKAILAPMIEHHHANNDHHIEHHPLGLVDMTLPMVVEMFCDILASGAARNPDGKVNLDLDVMERQGIPGWLRAIFRNTAEAWGIPYE